MVVPGELLLRFLQDAARELEEIDPENESRTVGGNLLLSDCRRCVLAKQERVLSRTVIDYNNHNTTNDGIPVSVQQVQQRLANLKQEPHGYPGISDALTRLDDSARIALCKLLLYSEMNWKNIPGDGSSVRELQTEGRLDRSKLLDYIALCKAALKLPGMHTYLSKGTPLFPNVFPPSDSSSTEPAVQQLPQVRLERIQRYLSKAVGWDPDFTTDQLRQLLLYPHGSSNNSSSNINSDYSNDMELLNLMQNLILQMGEAVSKASLDSTGLSDKDHGGVTRVVSVQITEVPMDGSTGTYSAALSSSSPSFATAPTRMAMDPHAAEADQKRQIRLASEALRLQQELEAELLNMDPQERSRILAEAKSVFDRFIQDTMALPPGAERVAYMQSMDSRTSRLLAMHKLWMARSTSKLS